MHHICLHSIKITSASLPHTFSFQQPNKHVSLPGPPDRLQRDSQRMQAVLGPVQEHWRSSSGVSRGEVCGGQCRVLGQTGSHIQQSCLCQ